MSKVVPTFANLIILLVGRWSLLFGMAKVIFMWPVPHRALFALCVLTFGPSWNYKMLQLYWTSWLHSLGLPFSGPISVLPFALLAGTSLWLVQPIAWNWRNKLKRQACKNCIAIHTTKNWIALLPKPTPLPSQHDKIEQAPQLQGVLALLTLYLYHYIPKHAPLL